MCNYNRLKKDHYKSHIIAFKIHFRSHRNKLFPTVYEECNTLIQSMINDLFLPEQRNWYLYIPTNYGENRRARPIIEVAIVFYHKKLKVSLQQCGNRIALELPFAQITFAAINNECVIGK